MKLGHLCIHAESISDISFVHGILGHEIQSKQMPSHQCLTVQEALKVPVELAQSGIREWWTARYLGVTISKDLSWNSHIENITVHANRT